MSEEKPIIQNQEKQNTGRIIILLENANLEVVKVGNKYELLNCDDHAHLLKKAGKDPAEYRPDICHQMLLTLLDSPLNKSGRMDLYVHTAKNVLIKVNPSIRLPRTFKRFCGLMVQLLDKLKIRATNGSEKLLECIKNPIEDHFPSKCRKFAFSYHANRIVDMRDFVKALNDEEPVVYVFGAMAHGSVNPPYAEELLSISQYPLSGSVACARLCTTYEQHWNIL
eukprot:TRINITY_DN15073_c0_g1::TRINITY_DN15073_c0_g1_i1::g.24919::m.24919 TRINITY_DN15073_c0_g1::TRINITY_DN15073_c0_g1_i1::g.24919  ORF type:complete len:236 (+),score=39.49,sp/Q92979/NEP1_HUMAN/49.36/3e-82,EMG1/PF03587.9/1.2e-71,Pox_C4_C10/PF03336.8/0.0077 TRINITY_DN15073_c0_g1_i1:37-708(+)